jgi:hypothetical protein
MLAAQGSERNVAKGYAYGNRSGLTMSLAVVKLLKGA